MHELRERFSKSPRQADLRERVQSDGQVTVSGVVNSTRSLLAAWAVDVFARPVVFVADDEATAHALLSDLRALAPELNLLHFNPDSPRLAASLSHLSEAPTVVVATVGNLNKPAPVPGTADSGDFGIARGAALHLSSAVAWLEDNGYERTDLVTEPGEYATRGGIVDVFPENAELPLRVEFAGDEVASLRAFDPLLQRSASQVESVFLPTRKAPEHKNEPASTLIPDTVVCIGEGVDVKSFASVVLTGDANADIDLGFASAGSFLGNLELLRSTMATPGHDFLIACSTGQRCDRLRTLLGPGPHYFTAALSAGFSNPAERWTLLTEREVYGSPVIRPVKHRFKGLPVDNVVALRPGDYVVHIDYGVGRFEGTRSIAHAGIEKDFLVIAYAGKDKVYVPVENLGLLDRYVGDEDSAPTLDRLGGRSWLIAKAKAARASAEYAEELLQVYARRMLARGTAFGADDQWQAELEASFPYEETQDQLKALTEVKRDMEHSRPMDRLVCGDVGYGKTEIALRAAFKTAIAPKQAALLAPTTILCYQHYVTFRKRLARFPLRIEMLSRLVPPAKQKEILDGLCSGVVDIVIGTHQLLGSRIRFRDLGLLIIDEEQKFGVRQKERIKALRASVDVLTLTATPIPRTLYMGLAGLRDISRIDTPPPGRREVQTEVVPWNDGLIHDYVQRELDRGGQVFFVHNEIQSIETIGKRLGRLMPGLKLAIAHGQTPGRLLADIYLNFAAGEYQVLLSTAIIESGLDMPNVNTIIVNRADRFGLSDLHQLRGRVGRSQEQAYALFMIPTQQEVTPDARKRLSALLAYSRLGSGFKLAMRDMEIRGVGNLLGTEQHGHVARVGFNLYTQMLKDAVAKLKGETVAVEPELKLDVPASIPKDYVDDSFERVAIYKRMLAVESEQELEELRAELTDRFGKYPPAMDPLFQVALVRVRCRKLGLLKITLKNRVATIVRPDRTLTVKGGIQELLAWLNQDQPA